jgi:hypothetical protein
MNESGFYCSDLDCYHFVNNRCSLTKDDKEGDSFNLLDCCTCKECLSFIGCTCIGDGYNIDGDCLLEK